MRVISYQFTEWLRKIVLLTLAASRGVTDLYHKAKFYDQRYSVYVMRYEENV